ncbi:MULTISPECIES: TonB family protein [unclassified Bradyrhizobium]|uniref:energy transducer TonB family protein n=1 Tax=unclassified Bradyrhizobium TaxID=2631580 RepID=UPI0028E5003A|nr:MULTISPECIES: TonB family protein [unclassified Bradyrhizobium]
MSMLRGAGTALAIAMIVPGIAAAEGTKDVWINSLSVKLTAQRRYPPQATGQGGTARVVFHIDRSGHLLSAALAESAGDPALDKEALAIVERAQPFPPPPPDVGEDTLTLRVRIVFPPRPKSNLIEDIGPDDAALRARLKGVCRGC